MTTTARTDSEGLGPDDAGWEQATAERLERVWHEPSGLSGWLGTVDHISMHGVTMMFLFAMPVLSGFGNYFVR